MTRTLSLPQLEAFIAVAATANFRAAAERLHVSQPALSRTIRLAEESLTVRLFDRDTKRVALTPAGQELLPIAQRVLADFTSAFSELGQFFDGHRGHIKVASLPSAVVAILPPVIAAFKRARPQVRFTLLEGPADFVQAALHDGRADFGLTVRPEANESFQYRHFVDDPFVLLCREGDALASRKMAYWSVFETQPFIASRDASSIRPITEAVFRDQQLKVDRSLDAPSIATVGALVRSGLGLSALPKLSLHLMPLDGLRTVPLGRPSISRPIGLVTHAGRTLAPTTLAFMDALASEAASKSKARR